MSRDDDARLASAFAAYFSHRLQMSPTVRRSMPERRDASFRHVLRVYHEKELSAAVTSCRKRPNIVVNAGIITRHHRRHHADAVPTTSAQRAMLPCAILMSPPKVTLLLSCLYPQQVCLAQRHAIRQNVLREMRRRSRLLPAEFFLFFLSLRQREPRTNRKREADKDRRAAAAQPERPRRLPRYHVSAATPETRRQEGYSPGFAFFLPLLFL